MSQFIEVLEFLDGSGKVVAARMPQAGSGEIKYGAQLIVQQNQAAIFVKDGRFLDTFNAGRHTLITENIPFLTSLLSLPYNFQSPFRASVYFVALNEFTNLKWGTPEPILFKDSEFEYVRLGARGVFSVKITAPELFLGKIAGTKGRYLINELEDFLRNKIISQFSDTLATNITSALALPKIYDELGLLILNQLKGPFNQYGIELCDLKLLNVNMPPELQRAVDERASMAAAGNIDKYIKFKTAGAIDRMAGAQGTPGSAAANPGFGLAFGQMLSKVMKNSGEPDGGESYEHSGAVPAVKCRKCFASNPAAAKFCINCATRIIPEGFCEPCSFQNPPGAKFCMQCGSALL